MTASVASPWLADRLSGRLRMAPVLARGAHAVYVDDGGVAVAVLAGRAVAVPVGLRTRLDRLPADCVRAETATVGEGAVRLGGHRFAVARLAATAVPRLPGLAARSAVLPGLAGLVGPAGPAEPAGAVPDRERTRADLPLDAVLVQLPPDALRLLAVADPGAVTALLGLGDGLTPVGDDVLAGWLVTRHAAGLDGEPVAAAVARARDRTTTLSATLLDRAAAGETVPPLRHLLAGVAAGLPPERVRALVDDLLAVGHSSGAGLALGACLALAPVRTGVPA